MKPMEAVFMICLGVVIGGAAVYLTVPQPRIPASKENVSIGEVTDLINRLRPFARDPDSEWRGITVKLTGASAKVEIYTKEGTEMSGGGTTLKGAVSVLQDSAKLKLALDGWGVSQ
jgi:hypothetical protein